MSSLLSTVLFVPLRPYEDWKGTALLQCGGVFSECKSRDIKRAAEATVPVDSEHRQQRAETHSFVTVARRLIALGVKPGTLSSAAGQSRRLPSDSS